MREDGVLQGIAARVAARDYSDHVYIRPGCLDANGARVLEPMPEGTRWVEERGSQRHLAALAVDAERVLGHPLPPLLRRI
jgi:hypothetical protein